MKQILAICCLSAACLSATAQSINIKGKVTDGKEPIIGATISVEGSNRNTVTDIDGNYSIEVPAGGTLTYSYVGYHQVKKKVKQGVGVLNIAMSEDQQQMDEVVVTALNIKRNKRSLGYATDQITAADLNVGNETNMLNQLTGKVAGVQITAGNSGAGSSSRVIIRGESSLSSNNQPLYVVDGVPINNNTYTNLSGTPQEIDYGNGAGELNADDMKFSDAEEDVVLRPFRIAKSCGCRFYCGSDAHHPGSFENCRAIFERAIDRLGLQESDKFHIERA